jgi:hypothetical protein
LLTDFLGFGQRTFVEQKFYPRLGIAGRLLVGIGCRFAVQSDQAISAATESSRIDAPAATR